MVRNKNTERRLREILRSYYEVISSGSANEQELKGRFNGYSEALLSLGKIDKEALKEIIDEEHLQCLGMSREARFYQVSGSDEVWSLREWKKFDRPAYERIPRRCRRK